MKGEENGKGDFVISEIDIKSILIESFEGENGMLEVCKAQYAQAKKGSLPHAVWITNILTGTDDGEDIKKFLFSEEVIE